MKTLLATTLLALIASTAHAESAPDDSAAPAPGAAPQALPQPPAPATRAPLPTKSPTPAGQDDDENGWHRPAGERFSSGFRLGGMYLAHYDEKTRSSTNSDGSTTMTSIKDELGLKSPYMFLIGYEGFYRIVGHSWLNVLMVGNISVAGLEQSKFIPTGNGLLGFEIDRSFEIGVGVNLVPDTKAPSHMIAAAGWTPRVGSIQTPVHVFYIPDTSGNSRTGMTVGMNW